MTTAVCMEKHLLVALKGDLPSRNQRCFFFLHEHDKERIRSYTLSRESIYDVNNRSDS